MDLSVLNIIDEKKEIIDGVADYLWENPETAFTEFKSAAKLCQVLRDEGFTVEEGLAGIATAFSGTFGSGKPVIGVLGEFDALSGLGQVEGVAEPIPNGQECGHGCGHNLLGAGSLGAAIAIKHYLETTGREGTVIYFGCPGEEGGSGKAFMARDGVFDCLDAALCWHPDDITRVRIKHSLANYQVLYKFDGISAHAGAKPHLGRSALDAVELMDMGVNYMREHMIDEARIHYAIVDTGGFSPNVVQAHAEVLYLIRAPHNRQVKELYERVCDIAEGAALMTGTKASHEFIKGCSSYVHNHTLLEKMSQCMSAIGVPEPTEEDIAFARAITENSLMAVPNHDLENPIHWQHQPFAGVTMPGFGSTDVSDVCWVCPTVELGAATNAYSTPGHSWQMTVQSKTPWAKTTMRYAAKVMAATAIEIFEDPVLLRKAKEEHKQRVGDGYVPPIPKGVMPRAMNSFGKK